MKIQVIVEREGSGYIAYTESTESTILGTGKTVKEAKKDFINTYKEICSLYEECRTDVPDELKEAEFEYKYDIPALFNEFGFFNVSRLAEEIGIGSGLMRYYKTKENAYISREQALKIQEGLHEIGKRLTEVTL